MFNVPLFPNRIGGLARRFRLNKYVAPLAHLCGSFSDARGSDARWVGARRVRTPAARTLAGSAPVAAANLRPTAVGPTTVPSLSEKCPLRAQLRHPLFRFARSPSLSRPFLLNTVDRSLHRTTLRMYRAFFGRPWVGARRGRTPAESNAGVSDARGSAPVAAANLRPTAVGPTTVPSLSEKCPLGAQLRHPLLRFARSPSLSRTFLLSTVDRSLHRTTLSKYRAFFGRLWVGARCSGKSETDGSWPDDRTFAVREVPARGPTPPSIASVREVTLVEQDFSAQHCGQKPPPDHAEDVPGIFRTTGTSKPLCY